MDVVVELGEASKVLDPETGKRVSILLHCSRCDGILGSRQFGKRREKSNGRGPWCKPCMAAYSKQWAIENAEHRKAIAKACHVRKTYGLTVDEYDALMAQGCSVCGATERMVLDHCHATGNVRGPLCHPCNHALGAASDDPQRLRALADYLEKHSEV